MIRLLSPISDNQIVQEFNQGDIGPWSGIISTVNALTLFTNHPFHKIVTSPDELIDIVFSVPFARTLITERMTPRIFYHAFLLGPTAIAAPSDALRFYLNFARIIRDRDDIDLLNSLAVQSAGTSFTGAGFVVNQVVGEQAIQLFAIMVGRMPAQTTISQFLGIAATLPTSTITITQPESVLGTPSIQQVIQEEVEQGAIVTGVDLGPTIVEPAPSLQAIIDEVNKIFPPTQLTIPTTAGPAPNVLLLLILAAGAYGLYEFFRRRRR